MPSGRQWQGNYGPFRIRAEVDSHSRHCAYGLPPVRLRGAAKVAERSAPLAFDTPHSIGPSGLSPDGAPMTSRTAEALAFDDVLLVPGSS